MVYAFKAFEMIEIIKDDWKMNRYCDCISINKRLYMLTIIVFCMDDSVECCLVCRLDVFTSIQPARVRFGG